LAFGNRCLGEEYEVVGAALGGRLVAVEVKRIAKPRVARMPRP